MDDFAQPNDFARTSSGLPLQPVYGPADRHAAGAAAVYPTGTPLEDILTGVRKLAMETPCASA